MKKLDHTIKVYISDKRCKKGERLLETLETKIAKEHIDQYLEAATLDYKIQGVNTDRIRYDVQETYVTRRNLMSGNEYQERYDTPLYCSPSSETYWSM